MRYEIIVSNVAYLLKLVTEYKENSYHPHDIENWADIESHLKSFLYNLKE